MYAGFWKRVAAYLIDGVILAVANLAVGSILGFSIYAPSKEAIISPSFFIANIVNILIIWLYYAFLESSVKQASVGKMALGIKVTDLDGKRISFARATGRHFAKIISSLVLGIGYLMVGFTKKKQGLHDIIAKCLVVNKPPHQTGFVISKN